MNLAIERDDFALSTTWYSINLVIQMNLAINKFSN